MDLSNLPKMGPKSLEALKSAGIVSLSDFLYNIPRTYLDQTKVSSIGNLHVGERAVVIGKIIRGGVIRGRGSRFVATLADGTGEITLTFFKGASYQSRRLQPGTRWLATGVVGEYRGLQMTHPDMQPMDDDEEFCGQILPVYSMTEAMIKARITQRALRNWFSVIFHFPALTLSGICPRELTDYLHYKPVIDDLRILHKPADCLRMVKRRESQKIRGHERQIDLGQVMLAKSRLPFNLTGGQDAALNRIIDGLNGKKQFHALLQGDVGCGKTVVALLAMLAVCGAGEQCALMVPTDILARQHFKQMKPFFEAAGMRIQLLVGATPAAEKRQILGELQMGLCQAVIGTHALFSKDVTFAKLGFVIIDEQHRFGVNQREALLSKGEYPDMLVTRHARDERDPDSAKSRHDIVRRLASDFDQGKASRPKARKDSPREPRQARRHEEIHLQRGEGRKLMLLDREPRRKRRRRQRPQCRRCGQRTPRL